MEGLSGKNPDSLKRYRATLYIDPEIPLPTPSEITAFVFEDYSLSDMNQEELWTEEVSYISYSRKRSEEIRIFVSEGDLTVVKMNCRTEKLLARAVYVVALLTGGVVFYGTDKLTKVEMNELTALLGEDFNLSHALQRVEDMMRRLPPLFEQHAAFLADYVTERLSSFVIHERKTLSGRTTHPKLAFHPWIGKGYEGYTNFAFDSHVPEKFLACLVATYSAQKWMFVLWKREGRRFWFTTPIFHLYSDGYDITEAADDLKDALRTWENENGDVFYMGKERLHPKIENMG